MPIFTIKIGTRVPIFLEYKHPGAHISINMGTRVPIFWGVVNSHDTGPGLIAHAQYNDYIIIIFFLGELGVGPVHETMKQQIESK